MAESEERCLRHGDQPLRFVCVECDELICLCCKLSTHEPHKVKDIASVADAARSKLKMTSSQLVTCAHSVEMQIKTKKRLLHQFENSVRESKLRLKKKTDQILAWCREIEEQLERKAAETRQEQQQCIEDLERTLVDLNRQQYITENVVKSLSDIEPIRYVKQSPRDKPFCGALIGKVPDCGVQLVIVDEHDNNCQEVVQQYLGKPASTYVDDTNPALAFVKFEFPNRLNGQVLAVHSKHGQLYVLYSKRCVNSMTVNFAVFDLKTKSCQQTGTVDEYDNFRSKFRVSAINPKILLIYRQVEAGSKCDRTIPLENSNAANEDGYLQLREDMSLFSLRKSKRPGMFNVWGKRTAPEDRWRKVFKIKVCDPLAVCADSSRQYFAVIDRKAESNTHFVKLFRRNRADCYAAFQPKLPLRIRLPAESDTPQEEASPGDLSSADPGASGGAVSSRPQPLPLLNQIRQNRQADSVITVGGQHPAVSFLPSDICFNVLGSTEVLLVADKANDVIYSVDFREENVSSGRAACFHKLGSGCPILRAPSSLAVDDCDTLWIACEDGNILRCFPEEDLRKLHLQETEVKEPEKTYDVLEMETAEAGVNSTTQYTAITPVTKSDSVPARTAPRDRSLPALPVNQLHPRGNRTTLPLPSRTNLAKVYNSEAKEKDTAKTSNSKEPVLASLVYESAVSQSSNTTSCKIDKCTLRPVVGRLHHNHETKEYDKRVSDIQVAAERETAKGEQHRAKSHENLSESDALSGRIGASSASADLSVDVDTDGAGSQNRPSFHADQRTGLSSQPQSVHQSSQPREPRSHMDPSKAPAVDHGERATNSQHGLADDLVEDSAPSPLHSPVVRGGDGAPGKKDPLHTHWLSAPIFSQKWTMEKRVSTMGDKIAVCAGVSLNVPQGAVGKGMSVDIYSSVCEDKDRVGRILKLPNSEHIASLLAEFWVAYGYHFETPVVITLRHEFPSDLEVGQIRVYCISHEVDGQMAVARLRPNFLKSTSAQLNPDDTQLHFSDSPDDSTVCWEKTGYYQLITGYVEITIDHMSAYVCTYVDKVAEIDLPPDACASRAPVSTIAETGAPISISVETGAPVSTSVEEASPVHPKRRPLSRSPPVTTSKIHLHVPDHAQFPSHRTTARLRETYVHVLLPHTTPQVTLQVSDQPQVRLSQRSARLRPEYIHVVLPNTTTVSPQSDGRSLLTKLHDSDGQQESATGSVHTDDPPGSLPATETPGTTCSHSQAEGESRSNEAPVPQNEGALRQLLSRLEYWQLVTVHERLSTPVQRRPCLKSSDSNEEVKRQLVEECLQYGQDRILQLMYSLASDSSQEWVGYVAETHLNYLSESSVDSILTFSEPFEVSPGKVEKLGTSCDSAVDDSCDNSGQQQLHDSTGKRYWFSSSGSCLSSSSSRCSSDASIKHGSVQQKTVFMGSFSQTLLVENMSQLRSDMTQHSQGSVDSSTMGDDNGPASVSSLSTHSVSVDLSSMSGGHDPTSPQTRIIIIQTQGLGDDGQQFCHSFVTPCATPNAAEVESRQSGDNTTQHPACSARTCPNARELRRKYSSRSRRPANDRPDESDT